MKRITMLLGAGILFLCSMVYAAVPQLINFQGILRDGSGNPVADGSYSVVFTIYDDPTAGINLWTETQSVTTTGGLFAVELGASTPLGASIFPSGADRYLGLTVASDPEISPRTRLNSVAYAYLAENLACSSCVSAAEVADEPGVTGNTNQSSAISLSTGIQTILSHSITVPAGGYVLAIGTLYAEANNNFATAEFGVSKSAGVFPPNQNVRLALNSQGYAVPVTVHGLFSVSAGTTTFYLLGNEIGASSDVRVGKIQLSLVYFPTAYGTVFPTAAVGGEGPLLESNAAGAALTAAEPAEVNEFNAERIARELAQVRSEMEALKRELREQRQQIDD